ncbi:hypothetical protein JAAARDRAFT_62515 [Jaapia argillacea MUCL 33604]|uniref:DUF6589 domain-containing protein n=1 Tax=Jaapia argillacea MUCL 33604 TaxID=933084 RepID=A0A067P9A0_9AGAM|nr:hypothetical protein JAAARDRAFT_62515 [Jaapia argillacea MUCL 33604]
MSHKWSVEAIKKVSKKAMEDAHQCIHRFPWISSHDNVNITPKNKNHFDNGTVGTIFFRPFAPIGAPLSNSDLKRKRTEGSERPISIAEIIELGQKAALHIQRQAVHHVLRYLLECPEFDYPTYQHQDDPCLYPPQPRNLLPDGPESITQQFVLGIVQIEEASYEGNEKLLKEWFAQLRLNSELEKKATGAERVIPWIGDQLTIERLCGLFKFHCQDLNSFDRLDWLVLIFGWFHLEMAFAGLLHKQYLGSEAG